MPIEEKKQEEVKTPTAEELLAAGTQSEGEQEQQEPEYTEVEKQAMAQGWKPKDQWEGDPNQHRSAREYIDRGELLGKIKSQNQQLNELRTGLQQLSDHNKRVYMAGYENAIKELRQQRTAALKEGDVDAAAAIEEKLDDTKDKLAELKQQNTKVAQAPQTSEITRNWLAANQWYQQEPSMKYAANGYAQQMASQNPNVTEEEVYEYIDKQIRKDFPHKFERQQQRSAPSPDGDSRRSVGGKGGAPLTFEKILGNMTEEQQSIARSLVKTGAITKEKYVEDWVKITGGR